MRRLTNDFIDHLQGGMLAPLRNWVRADPTLCMEPPENYVNVYYLGGSLLKLSAVVGGYNAFFDPKYAKAGVQPSLDLPAGAVREPAGSRLTCPEEGVGLEN